MLRAVLTLGGTVAGLAALLTFKSHAIADAAPAASTPPVSAATSQPAVSATASLGATASKASATTSAQAVARTVTGKVATTSYGPMQVQVTLDGTKITKVTVLQQTDDGGTSNAIDAAAIPKLNNEALAAQSAHID